MQQIEANRDSESARGESKNEEGVRFSAITIARFSASGDTPVEVLISVVC